MNPEFIRLFVKALGGNITGSDRRILFLCGVSFIFLRSAMRNMKLWCRSILNISLFSICFLMWFKFQKPRINKKKWRWIWCMWSWTCLHESVYIWHTIHAICQKLRRIIYTCMNGHKDKLKRRGLMEICPITDTSERYIVKITWIGYTRFATILVW